MTRPQLLSKACSTKGLWGKFKVTQADGVTEIRKDYYPWVITVICVLIFGSVIVVVNLYVESLSQRLGGSALGLLIAAFFSGITFSAQKLPAIIRFDSTKGKLELPRLDRSITLSDDPKIGVGLLRILSYGAPASRTTQVGALILVTSNQLSDDAPVPIHFTMERKKQGISPKLIRRGTKSATADILREFSLRTGLPIFAGGEETVIYPSYEPSME